MWASVVVTNIKGWQMFSIFILAKQINRKIIAKRLHFSI